MKVMLKKIFISLCLMQLFWGVLHAQNVTFRLTESNTSADLKETVEQNVGKLLTKMNVACTAKRTLSFDDISITAIAKDRLSLLWDNCSWHVEDSLIIVPVLRSSIGYEVRSIPVVLEPVAHKEYTGDTYRELSVTMDDTGQITGVRFVVKGTKGIYSPVAGDNMLVRRTILSFVEDYQSYYYEKNLYALENVFGDHGFSVVDKGDVISRDSEYFQSICGGNRNKNREFINSIKSLFMRNRYADVNIDKVEIQRHSNHKDIYGLTMHQTLKTSKGMDDIAWVFMLLKIEDSNEPLILLTVVQPFDLPREDVFQLDDFILP